MRVVIVGNRWTTHTAMTNNSCTTPPLLGRAHVDPHADAIAGLVGQLGHAATPVVDVRHAVAVDALLHVLVVVRLAALHRVRARRRRLVVAVAAARLCVADARTDDRARGSRRAAAVTMTDLVADRRTDHGAEQRRATRIARPRRTVVTVVVARLVPAFALRRADAHLAHERLHVDDLRVVVTAVVVVTIIVLAIVLTPVLIVVTRRAVVIPVILGERGRAAHGQRGGRENHHHLRALDRHMASIGWAFQPWRQCTKATMNPY